MHAAAGLAVLLSVTVLAALVALTEHEAEQGAQRRLAAEQGAAVRVSGAYEPGGVREADGAVRSALDRVYGGVPHRTERLLRAPASDADQVVVRSGGAIRLSDDTLEAAVALTLLAPEEPARHARLAAGRWPAGGGEGLQIAVRADFAERHRLRPGGTLTLGEKGETLRARITGTYRPRDGGAPLWDRMTGSFGTPDSVALAPPGAFARIPALEKDASATWLAVPDAERVRLGDIGPLRGRSAEFGGSNTDLTVFRGERPPLKDAEAEADLPYALRTLDVPVAVTRGSMYIPAALLAALATATLLLTARQLHRHRESEQALRVARGGGPLQVTGEAAAQWALVAVPAAVAGPLLAGPLLRLLHDAGLLDAVPPPTAATAAGWTVAAGALVVHGAAVLVPAARAARDRRALSRLRLRGARWAAFQRAGTDLALAAVAVLAWWQLETYRSPVAGGGTLDPVLVLAPVAMTAAAVLLALRLLPLAGRGLDRLARRSSGLVLPLGGWQLGRRHGGHAGPVLLVALALAVATLSGTAVVIMERGDRDQAAFQNGADLRVRPEGDKEGFVAAPQRRGRLEQLPGVGAVSPVIDVPTPIGSESGALTAVNTRELAPTQRDGGGGPVPAARPDVADGDLAGQLRRLAAKPAAHGIGLPGLPRELTMRVRLEATGPGTAEPFRFGLTLEDADGLAHTVSQVLPAADGKSRRIRFELGRRSGPLRITSLQLSTEHESERRTYRLTIDEFEGAGEDLDWRDVMPEGPAKRLAGCPGMGGPPKPDSYARDATGYVLCEHRPGPGKLLDAVLRGPNTALPEKWLSWRLALGLDYPARERLRPVPALAGDQLIRSGQASPGSRVEVSVDNAKIPVEIVGRIGAIPGFDPDESRLLVDTRVLSAALVRLGRDPLGDEAFWWLSADGGDASAALAAVRRAPELGTATDIPGTRAELAAAPLRTAPEAAYVLCLVLAPAFAVIGFALHTVLAVRRRAGEFALLRALGVRRRQLTGVLWTEQLGLALYGAVVGAVAGTALACVITPVFGVDAHGSPVFPELVPVVPWGRVLLLTAGTALVICLAVSAAARVLARVELARVLRAGEEGTA
ncbi:ABC transporter permease [Streptomyces sp. A7024]|uniref:ABC transporter permease n=1 Tax=Streptomyces coryli TaxID=1128680 RepID=A0A6G4U3G2_9ACTN|nr:ABC transporter permease [Streptomyces coryli]